MAGPSRFSAIESEQVTVTKPSKVTGPLRLTLRLAQPTDLGERYSEITITEEMLTQEVVPVSDVIMVAYNRLRDLLFTQTE